MNSIFWSRGAIQGLLLKLSDTAFYQCPFFFTSQLLKALFFTNMASHSDLPSASGPRKPGKATRLTASMKPGLYHDCFIAPYTQYTQSLTSMGPKVGAASENADNENTG